MHESLRNKPKTHNNTLKNNAKFISIFYEKNFKIKLTKNMTFLKIKY